MAENNDIDPKQIKHNAKLWSEGKDVNDLLNAVNFYGELNTEEKKEFRTECRALGRDLPTYQTLQKILQKKLKDEEIKAIFDQVEPAKNQVPAGGNGGTNTGGGGQITGGGTNPTGDPKITSGEQTAGGSAGQKRHGEDLDRENTKKTSDLVIDLTGGGAATLNMTDLVGLSDPAVKKQLDKTTAQHNADRLRGINDEIQEANETAKCAEFTLSVARRLPDGPLIKGVKLLPRRVGTFSDAVSALNIHLETGKENFQSQLPDATSHLLVKKVTATAELVAVKATTAAGGFGGIWELAAASYKLKLNLLVFCIWLAMSMTHHWPNDNTGLTLVADSIIFATAVYDYIVPAYLKLIADAGFCKPKLVNTDSGTAHAVPYTAPAVQPSAVVRTPKSSTFVPVPDRVRQIAAHFGPYAAAFFMCVRCGYIGKNRIGHTDVNGAAVSSCNRAHSCMNNVAFADYDGTWMDKAYEPEEHPILGQSVLFYDGTKDNLLGVKIPVIVDPRRVNQQKIETILSRMPISNADKKAVTKLLSRPRPTQSVALGPLQGPEAAN